MRTLFQFQINFIFVRILYPILKKNKTKQKPDLLNAKTNPLFSEENACIRIISFHSTIIYWTTMPVRGSVCYLIRDTEVVRILFVKAQYNDKSGNKNEENFDTFTEESREFGNLIQYYEAEKKCRSFQFWVLGKWKDVGVKTEKEKLRKRGNWTK